MCRAVAVVSTVPVGLIGTNIEPDSLNTCLYLRAKRHLRKLAPVAEDLSLIEHDIPEQSLLPRLR